MMDMVVTTGAVTNQYPTFTGRMPFLSPNQHCKKKLKGTAQTTGSRD